MATEVVRSVVDVLRDVPWFGHPVGFDMQFWVVGFFGDERSAGEVDFGVEVFFKAGERVRYFSVWATGDRDEFHPESDDVFKGAGDVGVWKSEVVHFDVFRSSEVVPQGQFLEQIGCVPCR